ncbi:hypothetical protein J4227_04935 [Candidatus Woesearchaeota archaeon]|nr:hypothetical protein [Candidatus Woesearchaeota archaeon]
MAKAKKKEGKKKEHRAKQPGAPVCVGCLRWDKFGDSCWVYWEGKKFCTMKVHNIEEWKNMEQ